MMAISWGTMEIFGMFGIIFSKSGRTWFFFLMAMTQISTTKERT